MPRRELHAALSRDELGRSREIPTPVKRRRFLTHRGLVRAVLARYAGTPPHRVSYRYGTHGKPMAVFEGTAHRIEFNASHSGGRALLAVAAGRPVGVDVEGLRRVRGTPVLTRRFFTPRERRAVHQGHRRAAGSGETRTFLRLWTRKEAFGKAHGRGLFRDLAEVDVLGGARGGAGAGSTAVIHGGVRWYVRTLRPAAGYIGAVAVRGPPVPVEWMSW